MRADDAPGETAEQVQEWFYANCRVKTVLPTNFKYGYLVSAGLQDFKGRLVPRLLFKNGPDFAEVLVLSTKQFELQDGKPMIAPGSEPASRPTDITTSGVRSALTPNTEICETAAC